MYLRAYVAKTYGWSLDDIRALTMSELKGYHEIALRMEAHSALRQLNIADYPRAKEKDRKKLYKALRKQAFPDEKPKVVKLGEAMKVLNG